MSRDIVDPHPPHDAGIWLQVASKHILLRSSLYSPPLQVLMEAEKNAFGGKEFVL